MATMVKSMALEGIEGFPVEIEAATIRGAAADGLHHRPGRPGGKGLTERKVTDIIKLPNG